MQTSRVDVVITRLLDLFREVLPSDVAVVDGPTGPEIPREVVVVGDATVSQEWGALGNRKVTEEGTVEVFVNVAVPGDSADEARVRAVGYFALLEVALREHVTLDGLVEVVALRPSRVVRRLTDEGRMVEIVAAVTYRAHLYRT
jgi:hypothetical protein